VFTPGFIKRRDAKELDPVATNKAERVAEIRGDAAPLALAELESARNRTLRAMIRQLPFMKPQEIISAIEVLDSELSSKRVTAGAAQDKTQPTREEMIKQLNQVQK